MTDRIASSTPFIPSVAFGLKAVALAMKAKTARLVSGEAEALIEACQQLMPDDHEALAAVQGFAAATALDQPTAGRALHDFIITRGGQMANVARRTDEALRQQSPTHFDWQARKDCGHG
ncbi:hypothetical protein SAMN05444339_11018 [Loktanella atrilutea]|uniref:Uncharacterized protein n=1 Tax=Loktanella atrilutea TaxID=366533 RepID=A0A1M5DJK8_LOKAT|nr:hypothetical protein [Loktanella atrilutea]SHF67075.1 hypothetical protein SAMN05444339_11018 [Loktanella atrilutea]